MRMLKRLAHALTPALMCCIGVIVQANDTLLIEAESFQTRGGWVVDQQSMDQMGSPYLLAHGLGVPVGDASTIIEVPAKGEYRLLVRTRNWVANFGATGAPGKFQVIVDGVTVPTDFGTERAEWHWQRGGSVKLRAGKVPLALHDLTGFAGRCDAVVLTRDFNFVPPNRGPELAALRRRALRLPDTPPDAGNFDLVVVGGGMAGTCTAISAARLGVKVALIQNRPVLGGNNSSEVRVGLSGQIHQPPYPKLGDLVDEIGPVGHWNHYDARKNLELPRSKEVLAIIEKHPEKKTHNAGPASNYEDDKKLRAARAEKNLSLFLNMHAFQVETRNDTITAAIAKNVVSGVETKFPGRLFADCTGDGTLGYLAGADFRMGREGRAQTGESRAPEQPDAMTMGTSVQWYAVREDHPLPFPDCPWAVQFNDATFQRTTKGDWDWEVGMHMNQITEFEAVRDHAFRVIYGNWAYQKNHGPQKERLANHRLTWVAYIGGKRESRRLLGDVILQQQDIIERKPFPDACVTTTWSIDLHFPHPENSKHFPGREFRSVARNTRIKPYPIPFRCLFSRNVQNLMMAGRNISVTHVALGTVRVQRTTGMMGEVLGMAASLCKKHDTAPRGVYQNHFDELRELMRRGVGNSSFDP